MAQPVSMIDISGKNKTLRVAVARGRVTGPVAILRKIREGKLVKGDISDAARLAGVLAAKRTPEIVPLCHPVRLTHVAVDVRMLAREIVITATVKAQDATGVEMEALTACAAAALTVYDMAKAEGPGLVIRDIELLKKTGGKKDYHR